MKKKALLLSLLLVLSLFIGSISFASPDDFAVLELEFHGVISGEASGRAVSETGGKLLMHAEKSSIPSGIEKRLMEHTGDLYIIEFNGPIKEEQKEQLQSEAEVVLGDYIPDYAFMAQISEKQLEAVKGYEFVDDIQPYLPIYKLDPRLFERGMSKLVRATIVGFKDTRSDMNRYSSREESLDTLIELALSKDIVYIGAPEEFVPFNDVADGIIKAGTVRNNYNLSGDGQVVAVADTGLDTGVNNSTMHLDFQGRIKSIFALGRTNNANDPHGHGTHVAGSILGTGARSNGSFKGMAPGAQLVFQSIMDSGGGLGGLPSNLNTLFTQAWNEGARIHNNSWGADVNGAYTTSSQQVDQFIWNNDMTILFASGNAGPGTRTVGSPATAKNAITVGASENLRPSFGSYADNINHVAQFSSRGNTADGRIKPDIVAPGTYILSTRSSLAPNGNFWANYNSYYAYMGGTSMATPITTGGIALLREHFIKNRGVTPKPSLLKAAVIAGATDMGLGYPSNSQGWGRLDLEKAVNVGYVNEAVALRTGESANYTFNATAGKPLRITLVWTDYPGNPSASKQLVNDLDLIITAPDGTQYVGNDFTAPYNNNWDERNNVENVIINSPQSGTYSIEVNAWNVPSGPQRFSLAVMNH